MKTTFVIEKVANMVFITDEGDHIWKAWDVREFTERKLQNAIKRIQNNYRYEIEFIKTF